MKTMNIATVADLALDYLVAQCEGYTLSHDGVNYIATRGAEMRILGPNSSPLHYSPTTNRNQCGEITERERIGVLPSDDGWQAGTAWEFFQSESFAYHRQYGPTPSVAAMRCYVSSKRGEMVSVPEMLL